MAQPNYIVIPPRKWRVLLIVAFQAGSRTWGETYADLFNGGWRGPVDRNGFPTRHVDKWAGDLV